MWIPHTCIVYIICEIGFESITCYEKVLFKNIGSSDKEVDRATEG